MSLHRFYCFCVVVVTLPNANVNRSISGEAVAE